MNHPSLSIIITAMNEEGNLEPAVKMTLDIVRPRFDDYELIIINDGSRDKTGEIADTLVAADPAHILVHHNETNKGLDYSYRKGVELASKQYVGWVAGNNLNPRQGLEDTFDAIGLADIVLPYVVTDVRGLSRRIISRTVVKTLNLLFGLRVKYYTGPCVYRSVDIKNVKVTCQGSIALAEILIRLIKSGRTYVEVGLNTKKRTVGKSKTFRFKNFVYVGRAIAGLFWEIQIAGWFRKKDDQVQAGLETDQILS